MGKTNPYNLPDHRVLSPTDRLCCYQLTKKYLKKLRPGCSLQPRCCAKDRNLPDPNRGIPYSTTLSDFRELLTSLGYKGEEYSEHSHKRGIATESSSKGISDEQIQEQGGWTNPRTARLYINKKDKKTREYNKKLLG